MNKLLLAGALACLATAAFPQTQRGSQTNDAWSGFCGNYVQTASNAGECPDCRLLIADNPEIQMYFVEANNGWSAELAWVEGDPSVAAGEGTWGPVGGAHDGAPFDLDLSSAGGELFLRMSHHDPALGANIEATFRCVD